MTGAVRAVAVGVAVVLLGVLAACGSEQDPTLDTGEDGTGTTPPTSTPGGGDGGDDPRPDGLGLDLAFDEPLVAGQPVTWRLTVTNHGDAPAVLDYRTSQRGEVVLTQEGSETYRWSAGQLFAQVLGSDRLEPGASKTYELGPAPLEAPPGEHQLVASLVSDPAPPPVERAVVVEQG